MNNEKKTGRPRVLANDKKVSMTFRANQVEQDLIKRKASSVGLSQGQYLIKLVRAHDRGEIVLKAEKPL